RDFLEAWIVVPSGSTIVDSDQKRLSPGRNSWNCCCGRSFWLEIDGLNHAPPFADVGSKHCLSRFLIEVERLKAELLEPRGHFGIFQNFVDCHIKLVGDLVRRFCGQEKAGPC